MYDILVQNGMIADGSGKPLFKCNIGISEDRIVWIGNDRERKAVRTIDASGLVVAPGFIDMHAHDDLDLIVNPDAKPKVLQGGDHRSDRAMWVWSCSLSPRTWRKVERLVGDFFWQYRG